MSGKKKRESAASVTPKSRGKEKETGCEASDSSIDEYPTFQSWASDLIEVQILEENANHTAIHFESGAVVELYDISIEQIQDDPGLFGL